MKLLNRAEHVRIRKLDELRIAIDVEGHECHVRMAMGWKRVQVVFAEIQLGEPSLPIESPVMDVLDAVTAQRERLETDEILEIELIDCGQLIRIELEIAQIWQHGREHVIDRYQPIERQVHHDQPLASVKHKSQIAQLVIGQIYALQAGLGGAEFRFYRSETTLLNGQLAEVNTVQIGHRFERFDVVQVENVEIFHVGKRVMMKLELVAH